MLPEKLYITAKEASKLYGYSVAWFAKMRYEKKGPPYIRPNGGRVFYAVKDIVKYFETIKYLTRDAGGKLIEKNRKECGEKQ